VWRLGSRLRVKGCDFRVEVSFGSEFGVWDLGFGVRIWGLGFRVRGSGFRVKGSGFRV